MGGIPGKNANKLAAIAMVKNEADVIESFARHALCLVDVLLVTDHMSTDGTKDILQQLQAEGLPIRLSEFREPGQHQGEVMTRLLQGAVQNEGAELVLALDADEFLVAEQGSHWLRTYLQGLDTSCVYQLPWVDYMLCRPEEGQDKYLLSRPALRSERANPLGKVMLGAGAVRELHLTIEQGNHVAKSPELLDTVYGVATEPVAEGVHLAHFPRRSQAQQVSKNLCMWLSNLSAFTEYTYYAMDYQPAFQAYVEGRRLPLPHKMHDCIPARLERYAQECHLRYTAREVRPIANVLRMAEKLAAEYGRLRVLGRCPQVSVIVIFDGSRESFLVSWQSLLAQSYLPSEIFIVDSKELGTENIRAELEACAVPVQILPGTDWSELHRQVRGEFVQWLLPGDVLLPDKLRDMAALLCAQPQTALAINVTEKREEGWAPEYLGIDTDRLAYYFLGSKLHQAMVLQGETCNSNLTGILFRREVMEGTAYLQAAFMGDRVLPFTLWGACLQADRMAVLVQRDFVREAAHAWTADERILFEMEYAYLLQQAYAQEQVSEQGVAAAWQSFQGRRAALLAQGMGKQAGAELLAAYERCNIR